MNSRSVDQPTMRPLDRRDISELLYGEFKNFESPLSGLDLEGCLKRGNIATAAQLDGRLVGFVIYNVDASQCQILRLAVHADFRRKRVGTHLLDFVIKKARELDRKRAVVRVAESNLSGQKFFQNAGFLAINFDRRTQDDEADGGQIVMELRLEDSIVHLDDLERYQSYAFYLKDGSAICGDFRGFVLGRPARLRIKVANGEREPRTSSLSFVSLSGDATTNVMTRA